MKKIFKIVYTILIIILIFYIAYRNINLRKIPSVDLIKDEKTFSLYNSILPNTSNKNWTNYYYSNDYLNSENIPKEMKYNIAFKNMSTGAESISEKELKKSYEKIFGINTYNKVEYFIGGCNKYFYNNKNKTYEKLNSKNCPKNNISILSKIVDAKLTDENFTITVVIVYLDNNKKIVYKSCDKDMNKCNNVLLNNFEVFDEDNIDTKKYDLNKYNFTFKIIDDEYYFSSVKKVK